MADDRHYVPGSFYRICDRTGFKIRSGRTKKEWTGHIVRDRSYETRQPQDLVRGVPDYQAVPEPRPRSPNVFVVQQTTLAAALPARAVGGSLASIDGIAPGKTLSIMLDNGENAIVIVQSIGTGGATNLTWIPPLPFTASAGALVVNRSVGALNQPAKRPYISDQGNRVIVSQEPLADRYPAGHAPEEAGHPPDANVKIETQ